jgi:soluble lytic murein transglycosylase-like protein
MGTPVILRPGAASYFSGSSGPWADVLPAAGQSWAPAIEEAANEAGLDPRLLAAMVWQESGFEPTAVSKSGAIGLAQLMPATAEGLGVNPHDPLENLDGGARYLAWTIKEFGSLELGLAAYNAGPGNVRAANGIPNIPETQAYVPRVLDYYRQLGGIA